MTTKVVKLKPRRYDAASRTTRTSNWFTPSGDANQAINNPSLIRNRARDLVRNNPWANKGVAVIVNNTIGRGIRASWAASNKTVTKRAANIWREWSESVQCDAQGLTNFFGIQQTAMRAVVESGECLIRLRPRPLSDGLAVPFQLQVLEPDFFYEFNDGPTKDGNFIHRGVEFDSAGFRVAYHLYNRHPGTLGSIFGSLSNDFSRVPANEIIHLFRVDRPGQERGVSWLSPVIITLRELDIYEDAYLKRQQIANLFALFVISENPSEVEQTFTDLSELISGSIYSLKPGQTVDSSKPPPADDYGPYTLSNLKRVAAGLGITYEALTGDLSEVNFSSARMGWQEFGRSIDSWRWQMMIPRLCNGVCKWFQDFSGLPNLTAQWTPPARVMVDPAKELPPIVNAVRAGLMPLSEAIRERGFDPDLVLPQIAKDNALIDELNLILDSDPRNTSGQGQFQETQVAEVEE